MEGVKLHLDIKHSYSHQNEGTVTKTNYNIWLRLMSPKITDIQVVFNHFSTFISPGQLKV